MGDHEGKVAVTAGAGSDPVEATASSYLVDGRSVMAPSGPGDVGTRVLMESFSSNTRSFEWPLLSART